MTTTKDPAWSAEMARNKIQKAKFDINLVNYAEQYGYVVNRQKSTATDVILQKREAGEVIDTIGVRYYPQTGYKYWTAMDNNDKGSLLDFEKNKHGLDISSPDGKRELYQKIDAFLGNVPLQQKVYPKPADRQTEAYAQKRLTDKALNMLPLEDTRYLEGRGITAITYRSTEFIGQIYNEKVELKNGKTYTNTVFPIRNESILLAKIRRNDEELGYRGGQFNKIQEKRENGVHTSNFPKAGKIDKLYLVESPIDALSYFELHQKSIREQNEKVAFIATVGNPSHSAYNTIQKFINGSQPIQLVSLMDNDRAGRVFTINLLGKLNHPHYETSQHIKAEMSVSQKTEATLSIHLAFDTEAKREALSKQLKEYIIEPLREHKVEGSEAHIQVNLLAKSAHAAHVEIKFGYDMAHLKTVEKGLVSLKGLEHGFSIEHPKQKDWNEELKRQKPFVVTVEKNGVELPEKRFAQGVEAVVFIQEQNPKTTRKLHLEKYNVSHEVGEPQLMAKWERGQIKELNPVLEKEIKKQEVVHQHQKLLNQEKITALQIAQELFPANECVINKTHYNTTTQQHFIEMQTIENKPIEAGIDLPKDYTQKINQVQTHEFIICFNRNQQTTLLTVPALKESTLLEKTWLTTIQKPTEEQRKALLKKDLEQVCGELKLADRQGDVIATSDYNIQIEGGKWVIHRIENFDFEKISQEGLDLKAIDADLKQATAEQLQQPITQEQVQAEPAVYEHTKPQDDGYAL